MNSLNLLWGICEFASFVQVLGSEVEEGLGLRVDWFPTWGFREIGYGSFKVSEQIWAFRV